MSPSFALRRGALLLLLASGCQVYDPSLVSDAGAGGQCEGRQPPPRPDAEDDADAEPLIFGLRDVVLDQETDALWSRLGYNLDGYCTDAPDYAQECEPGQGARAATDGEDGIDNAFGSQLFPLVDAVVPGLEESSRMHQIEGGGLVVVRLQGWNGQPNDPRVHVSITQSVDTVPAAADGSAPEVAFEDYVAHLPSGEPAPPPTWDGRDYTWVRDDTFLSGSIDDPLVFDANAYIADDVFVVHLPDRVEIMFQGIEVGVMVRLTGGVATGRITEDRQRIEDVLVTGRWSVVDLLQTAESVGVCQGTVEYDVLRERLNAFVDVTSDTDPEPGTACDALSVGVAFSGYRLQLGGLVEGPELVDLCENPPDGGVDAGPTGADAGMDAGIPDAGP